MSVAEDSTFCHYCGRKASLELQLHWDHVPSLNVKIPLDYLHLVKKTLVRACSECNLRASDRPHMEYIERHIWLKNEYLRVYKKLLLSGKHESHSVANNDLIAPYINNSIVRYDDILHAIGFGLTDLSQITSPIINQKDLNGNYLRDILCKYLSMPVISDDTDDSVNESPNLDLFFNVLQTDFSDDHVSFNKRNYNNLYQRFGYRVENINMPRNPDILYGLTWDLMGKVIEIINEYRKQEKSFYVEDIIDQLNEDDDYFCSYSEFVDELANVMNNGIKNPKSGNTYNFYFEQDFETWFENHKSLLNQLGIPALPCHVYQKNWKEISSEISLLIINEEDIDE